MLLDAWARIKPSVSAIQGRKLNELSRQANSPARAAEIKVMMSTAARVEISHFEITSSLSHSSFDTSGITLRALRHIAKFISYAPCIVLDKLYPECFQLCLTIVRKILETHPEFQLTSCINKR